MDRIELLQECKNILIAINNGKYQIATEEDYPYMTLLEYEGLTKLTTVQNDIPIDAELTSKGKVYLLSNPKLKNPSIWDDTKYWIKTVFAFVALIISFISLLK